MTRRELVLELQFLAAQHPGIHPYTLALLWEQRTHQQLTGRQVRQLLQEPKPDSLVPVSQHIRASAR